jgi:hypothetical protein
MNNYGIGTQVRVQGTFKDLSGNLIDPTTVTFSIALPNKAIETAPTTHVSLGVYTADYIPTVKGNHVYKMHGEGACQVTAFGSFNATGDF